jgi:hypothetical protein
MAWDVNIIPSLFEISVPHFFITAALVLTRAPDVEEGATTGSLQKAEYVVPNACQDHVKNL